MCCQQRSWRWSTHTHTHTQGCRLHNTPASWKAGQYYWLTQDTGSSQRSSWKEDVPSLPASVFIRLSNPSLTSFKSFDKNFNSAYKTQKNSPKNTQHIQNKFFASQKYSCSVTHVHLEQTRYFTAMPYAGHAGYPHTCRNTPDTSSAHVTQKCEKQLKRCEIGVVSR